MLDCSLTAWEAALDLQIIGMVHGVKESHWGNILYYTEILSFASLKNMNTLSQIEFKLL